MNLRPALAPFLLLGLLAACAGVETGTVSPCHGRFRAQGKYFHARTVADGSIVISAMNAPHNGCAD